MTYFECVARLKCVVLGQGVCFYFVIIIIFIIKNDKAQYPDMLKVLYNKI